MQTLDCMVGNWEAHARIDQVEGDKLMAVISVRDGRGLIPGESRHTVVFGHGPGNDSLEETRAVIRRLLAERYGVEADPQA